MLLTTPSPLVASHWRKCAAVSAACACVLFLSACSIQYDDSYASGSRGIKTVEAQEKSSQNKAKTPSATYILPEANQSPDSEKDTPEDSPYRVDASEIRTTPIVHEEPGLSLFGMTVDNGYARGRKVRYARKSNRGPETPSFRELRQARAVALAESDLSRRNEILLVKSDGSSNNPDAVKFVEAPGALALEFDVSERSNLVDDLPNAVVLIIYHLSDRVALDRLAETEDGILELLEGKRFDESVKGIRQIFLQPGTKNIMEMPRAEGGRYVALVTGYNRPDKMTSLRVFSYGIQQYAAAGDTVFHSEKKVFRPLPLNLRVEIGPTSMTVSERGRIYPNMQNSYDMKPDTYYARPSQAGAWPLNFAMNLFGSY